MNTTIRTKFYTVIYCVLGTTALCALSTSVQAEDVPHKTVKFADLNITTQAGAKVLYQRIRAAAQEVCALSVGKDPILRSAAHGCIETAIDKAVKGVDSPVLTSLRFGGSGDTRLASK